MKTQVALIDFPRLQELIAARILTEERFSPHALTYHDVAERYKEFDLALFFWPDVDKDSLTKLRTLHSLRNGKEVPIVIVATEANRRLAEQGIKENIAEAIITTPMQPHAVVRRLQQILHQEESSGLSLDVTYINPFVEGTVDTIKQMAGLTCERSGLNLRTDATSRGDITGSMGLSGVAEGFVAVVFRESLARKIVCSMLQISKGEETEDDIRDGVGELMNMIAGAAKADLINSEHSFQLSLPTVVVGGPHSVGQSRGTPVMVIEFKCAGESFDVMVCLRPRGR